MLFTQLLQLSGFTPARPALSQSPSSRRASGREDGRLLFQEAFCELDIGTDDCDPAEPKLCIPIASRGQGIGEC